MCHTRELAFQISKEYERFSKFLPNLKASICCQPFQCSKEFAGPDPGRQELATKNGKIMNFQFCFVILNKTLQFYFSCKKLTFGYRKPGGVDADPQH
jgi:hypothetical protein